MDEYYSTMKHNLYHDYLSFIVQVFIFSEFEIALFLHLFSFLRTEN